jgi:hypothetical protein
VVQEIRRMHKSGRPVLVGTTSVEKSEVLARMLEEDGIPYQVRAWVCGGGGGGGQEACLLGAGG